MLTRARELLSRGSTYTLRLADGFSDGELVYEYDWDCLVLLDGCRPDAMETVASDYPYLSTDIDTFRSAASTSKTWMEKNFSDRFQEQMSDTAYVTANPYTQNLPAERFSILDEVWKYAWDSNHGTVPADSVTDRAIDAGRNSRADRMIVHYMQPHFPSVPAPLASGMDLDTFGRNWESPWDMLRRRDVSREEVWESYIQNLRYVLESLSVLFDNLDAPKVFISSDHANAFGEWMQYGHPQGVPIDALRRVPWVTTSATDEATYVSEIKREDENLSSSDVNDRLADLGYL